MKRLLVVAVALAMVLSTTQIAHARGEGWEDVFWGGLFGTSFGTILGGVSLIFYPSQEECDAHIYNIAIGSGIGLAAGVTYGALIGWPRKAQVVIVPSPLSPDDSTFVGLRKEF